MKDVLLFCVMLLVSVPLKAQDGGQPHEEKAKAGEQDAAAAAPPPAPPAPPPEAPAAPPPPEKPKTEVEKVKHLIAEDKERVADLEKGYQKYVTNPRTTQAEKLQARIDRNKRLFKVKVRIAHHELFLQELENPKPKEEAPKEENHKEENDKEAKPAEDKSKKKGEKEEAAKE